MREMSVTEQRYKAILAVIGDGRTVGEVARDWGVSPRTMHRWLARYEGDGLEGLNDRSHRPAHCPHQTSPGVEAMVLEMRSLSGHVVESASGGMMPAWSGEGRELARIGDDMSALSAALP